MKKMIISLIIMAIFVTTYSQVKAIYTYNGPIVDGKRTTNIETAISDGDISASRFRSLTNLSPSDCERLSKTHYDNVYSTRKYFYMYAQYFYNTTIYSVFNTKFANKGILLSNSGARAQLSESLY